jgi:hypothetical protein
VMATRTYVVMAENNDTGGLEVRELQPFVRDMIALCMFVFLKGNAVLK